MPKKSDKKIVAPVAAAVVQSKSDFDQSAAGTEAGAIWNEIKNKSIDMFSLPDQRVWQHCDPVFIEPNRLYLRTRSTSVLPSLEVSCGKSLVAELVDKYVIVARATVPLTQR